MVHRQPRRWLLLSLLATGMLTGGLPAAAQDLPALERELSDIDASVRRLRSRPLRTQKLRSPTYVEERLADGELFYRLKDYLRASVILTDVVEHYPSHRAYPDALMLLGESLYSAGDVYGARTRFRQILDQSEKQAYQSYLQRALGRLIDIALRTRDFRGVEEYFDRLNRIPPSQIEAATLYAKAKYLYNRAVEPDLSASADDFKGSALIKNPQELAQAQAAFQTVPVKSAYRPQADYFLGVIATLRNDHAAALKAFHRVVAAKSKSSELEPVRDLGYLALGRLYYETVKLKDAARAYQSVPRTSPHFDTALYEVAWVYIRQGDSLRAERSLEVLALAAPNSRYVPDAKVLRGNLLLRNGNFAGSTKAFDEVISVVSPVNRQLQDVVERHADPQAYVRGLVQEDLEAFDLHDFVPRKALMWAEPDVNMQRAMRVIADFGEANRALRETEQLVSRLDGALRAENRVNIFSDLRILSEQSVLLHNRLHRARSKLSGAYRGGEDAQTELGEIRRERKRLEGLLRDLPLDPEALKERERKARALHSQLSGELRELEVEISGITARLVALDTMAKNPPKALIQNQKLRDDLAAELKQQHELMANYAQRIAALRLGIEQATLRVGMGDERYKYDESQRNAYRRLVQREHELLSGGAGRLNTRGDQMLLRAERTEQTLDSYDSQVNLAANERAEDMLRKVGEEVVKLEDYHTQIASLGGEAHDVVGDVAYAGFVHLQKRFRDLVLRAEVGKVDLAWAEREEHRMRVEALTTDRAREIQALDDEFREIMDEQDFSQEQEEQTP